ncbi:MAG: MarR family winged helix-turn-helix transcriptional regulator [Bacillota bacterium]|nr:MarR family winged helix-turn-helix transcriptional regulator [Bacillota bacterium]
MKADNTLYLIAKAKALMNQFIISELNKQGIDGIVPSHGDIIISLLKHETLTMKELADKIERDPSTVTTLVKKLNNLGYTQVLKDSADKRANIVSLTTEGKALEAVFISISEKLYKKQYQNTNEEEKEIFRDVLKKMIENFR